MAKVIRHTIRQIFRYPGERIVFEGFGESRYKYREMNEAFTILEKAMILQMIYPVTSQNFPIRPNSKKRPKLQLLDTGLACYYSGMRQEIFQSKNLDDAFSGHITEHITGQEISALSNSYIDRLYFWTRESNHSSAEVDFVYPYKDMIIPIEVKKGAQGRLRSLHQFMDKSPHPYAVRVYSGLLGIQKAKTIAGTPYFLLNLPFFLVCCLDSYLDWFIKETGKMKNN